MSTNGPLSGISFSGLASGLDVESIVTQLMSIERVGITRLQAQQAQLMTRQTIYSQFRSQLNSLSSALSTLNIPQTFSPVKTSSSDETVATASGSSSAVAGTYSIEVLQLAQAHKSTSSAQANPTDPLGVSGSFVVNGKAVSVLATESMNEVASKINGLNAGVSASVLNGGEGNAFLVLTSNKTGAASAIQMADLSGGVLAGLGLVSGGSSVRDASAGVTTARSYSFSSETTALGTLMGGSGSGSITFGAGASAVAIDFASDTLQSIAAKINAAGEAGVTASVVPTTNGGTTTYQLQISGADVPGTLADPNGLLGALGVLQQGYGNQLVAAQDSEVLIDNLTVTRPTNSVSDVVQGLSLTLAKVGTSTVTVTRDTEAVKSSIEQVQKSFNDVISYIRTNSQFDDETFASGPLFGDQTAAQVESALNEMLFTNLGTGSFKNLTDIGFSLDSDGKLTLDAAKLTAALDSDIDGVKNLMLATGTSANPALKYVSSGSKTVASGVGGYTVEITQPATVTTALSGTAKTTGNVAGEVLTFSGQLFGSTPVALSIQAGASLADIITQINNDSRLKSQVSASDDGGILRIDSKRYGSASAFSVVSNLGAAGDTSGVGTTGMSVTTGLDVAGTINGEAATGTGQFLLGNEGNATTAGLQIQYSGDTAGVVGSLAFNRGLASLMTYRLNSFTDGVDGMLTATDKSISDQIADIESRIASQEELLELREQTLRLKYAAMEEAIARLNSQGSQLSSFLSGG